MKRIFVGIILVTLVIASQSVARAGTLYAGERLTGQPQLLVLDPITFAGVSPFGFNADAPITGLAFGNNSLYVSAGHSLTRYDLSLNKISDFTNIILDWGDLAFGNNVLYAAVKVTGQPQLLVLDPNTFAGVSPFGFNADAPITGLAFGDNSLYVSAGHSLTRYDLSLNKISDFTSIAIDWDDLAFGNNVLYAGERLTGQPQLLVLDPVTFAGVSPFGFNADAQITGLAFGDNSLYVSAGHSLTRYDLSLNKISDFTSIAIDWDDLAYAPIPDSWMLLLSGLASLGFVRRFIS